MPGVNILFVPKEKQKNLSSSFKEVQENMLHSQLYSYKPILVGNGIMIGFTAYGNYPRKIFETDSFLILLEGMIYNNTGRFVEKWLFDFASEITGGEIPREKLKRFLVEADGEFIVVIYNKLKEELVVFNDVMGRLPLYYHATDDSVFVSREIKFIMPFLKSIEFNKTSLIEYLLYGFPFGENTLIEKVYRIMPATFIRFDAKTRNLSKRIIVPLNFDNKMRVTKHSRDEIRDLKNLFLKGLENRITGSNNRKPIVFLSGGLDSRATLAGLIFLNTRPVGVTYVWNYKNEESYAISIAREFGIDITTLTFSDKLDAKDYVRIVCLKDGMNPTALAYLPNILEQLIEMHGSNVIAFNGLYGGEIFRYLNITMGINSVKNLSRFLLNTPDPYGYSAEKVCKMLAIDQEYLLEHLDQHLSTYEEEDVYKKYIHFRFEKDYKWAGEGEDRDRFFLWTTTPFFSAPFFNYSMSIDERTKDTLFFRNFLYALDPRTCKVSYHNDRDFAYQLLSRSLNNIWRLRLLRLAERLARHVTIRRYARSVINIKGIPKSIARENQERINEGRLLRKLSLDLLDNSSEIKKHFSSKDTAEILKVEENVDMLHRILTLFLYMNHVEKMR